MPGSIARGLRDLQRLVGGDVGQHFGVDVLEVLHAGGARPSGSGLIRRAAGQDEARVGVVEIGEQAFAVGARIHPVELGDVAGAEHARFSQMSVLALTILARSAGPKFTADGSAASTSM